VVDRLTNPAPLAFQHRMLERGRLLARTDEIAHADFVERTINRDSDVAIDDGSVRRGVRP